MPEPSPSGTQRPQPPPQPQYRAILIERTPAVVVPPPSERQFPIAALFFIFGFICPFFWIVGACCCAGSWQPYEAWWGNANLFMTVVFIMASLIYTTIMFATGRV